MSAVLEPSLNLDKRQRAMLKEMGVQVWQPLPVVTPLIATVAAKVAVIAAVPVNPAAINSGAARAYIQGAKGSFDTPKQAFKASEAPKTAPTTDTAADPRANSGSPSGWRIGKLQTLYPKSEPATTARWLVLLESPASALQDAYDPFEGDAGKLLDNMLRAAKLHTAGAALIAPLVRDGDDGNGLGAAMADVFAAAQANVVLVMGRLAAQALLQSTEPLAKLRGQIHTVQGQQTIITIDPAALLRNPLDKAKAWDDLCLAVSVVSSGAAQLSTP